MQPAVLATKLQITTCKGFFTYIQNLRVAFALQSKVEGSGSRMALRLTGGASLGVIMMHLSFCLPSHRLIAHSSAPAMSAEMSSSLSRRLGVATSEGIHQSPSHTMGSLQARCCTSRCSQGCRRQALAGACWLWFSCLAATLQL